MFRASLLVICRVLHQKARWIGLIGCSGMSMAACGGTQSEASTAAYQQEQTEDSDGDREEGKEHFDRGMAAMEEGDLDEACDAFEDALSADTSFGPTIALGNCLEKQKKFAPALRMYQRALTLLPPDDERRALVEELAEGLREHIAHLTLHFPQDAPEKTYVELEDDEMAAEQFGVALPLEPGKYRIEVKASGYDDRDYDVELVAGEERVLQLELGEP